METKREDFEKLCQGLGDAGEEERYKAAAVLHKIGLPALKWLIVSTENPDPLIRAMACNTIRDFYKRTDVYFPEKYFASEDFQEVVERMLVLQVQDEEVQVRQAALLLLGDWEIECALPDLCQAAYDPSDIVRLGSAIALTNFDNDFWEVRSEHPVRREVENALLQLVEDGDEDVRDWAIYAVRNNGCRSEPFRAALLKSLEDLNTDVRGEAALTMAAFYGKSFAEKLASMMANDPEPRHYYFKAAACLADRTLLPVLQKCIDRWRQIETPANIDLFSQYAEHAVAVLEGRWETND